MRSVKNPREFWTGVIYVAVGASAIVLARDYGLGTAFRMGPGYFPTALGGLLVLIGLVALGRAFLQPGDPLPPLRLKGVVAVTAATVAFGVLVRGAGVVVALPLLVVGSAAASARFRWAPALALAAALTLFSVAVFLKGLGVPLPILGPWLGG
jgi:putative tricarboxylic transport membrane protein